MTPAALLTALNSGSPPAVLDVRSRWEFARGHVPGAVHIPFWTLPMRVPELSSRDLPIVVYCGHGPRAWFAGAVLRATGFRRVEYLEGHMSKWKSAGFPQQLT
jgi:rhodanese-related sulfurtransferase